MMTTVACGCWVHGCPAIVGARRRHAAVALHAAAAGADLRAVLHLERLLRRRQRRLRLRHDRTGPTPSPASRPADFDVNGALIGGTLGYNMQTRRLRCSASKATSTGATSRARPRSPASAPARPPTTGSARSAAASATPSIASCPISPAARPSATSRARRRRRQLQRHQGRAGPPAAALEYAFSTTGRRRSNISTSISARRPATPPARGGNPFDVTSRASIVRGRLNYKF